MVFSDKASLGSALFTAAKQVPALAILLGALCFVTWDGKRTLETQSTRFFTHLHARNDSFTSTLGAIEEGCRQHSLELAKRYEDTAAAVVTALARNTEVLIEVKLLLQQERR